MTARAEVLIATLGLTPHPEGGYYGEIHRSRATVQPEDNRGRRPALTTIYFLLPSGAVSRWHRVLSDEVWHFYEGAPLELWTADPGSYIVAHHLVGPLGGPQQPVYTVPAGWWQAARSTGKYTLVGCTVGPGFDFRDFTLAADDPRASDGFRRAHPAPAELL
jgi:predicted cupin superfamily sugar epimerase